MSDDAMDYLKNGLGRKERPSKTVEQQRIEWRDELAGRVIHAFTTAPEKLKEHRQDIAKLWSEFEALTPCETIKGCRTKTEFAQTRLRREIRSLQHQIALPVGRSDSGDIVLDAFINEQNYVRSQMTGELNDIFRHAAVILEGKIVARYVQLSWKEE